MIDKGSQMVLPPPAQIGVVVKNLKEAIDFYSQTFGIGPFQMIEFAPAKHWLKGKPTPIRLNIGLCQWGPLQLELIEVVEGDIPHKWFLEEKGEGLQHLGFIVDNYDKWLSYLRDNRIDVLMNAETEIEGMGRVRAAYVESNRTGGVLFELIEITPK
jgi:methylmalonyl-CoA/ethylmalonyl-CoA epimerase